MGILLAFAPFIVFALIAGFVGPTAGLVSGAVVSAVMPVRDWLTPGRSPKILEIGATLLFGGLALYTLVGAATWSVTGVRLCVNSGLLLIVVVSIALRRPFTLQYARERVPRELWDHPLFVRMNYVITAVWGLAFAVMVIADLAVLFVPGLPRSVGAIAIVLALIGAFKFSSWYPDRVRAAQGSPAG